MVNVGEFYAAFECAWTFNNIVFPAMRYYKLSQAVFFTVKFPFNKYKILLRQ